MRALIIVDVQNDFCEGGSLAVAGGADVASGISEFVEENHAEFDAVLATQDWHVDPGQHFSDTPDFRTSWPVHCVAGTAGAELHPNLDTDHIEARFLKGLYSDGYSGFEGLLGDPERTGTLEGEKGTKVQPGDAVEKGAPDLNEWLENREIESVTIVGLATDHCVRATALDAVDSDYQVSIIRELTAGVGDVDAALNELAEADVQVISIDEFHDQP